MTTNKDTLVNDQYSTSPYYNSIGGFRPKLRSSTLIAPINLIIDKVTDSGNLRYVETTRSSDIIPNPDGVWTIQDPSPACIRHYKDLQVRSYDQRVGQPLNIMLSKKAAEMLPLPGPPSGETLVVETCINENNYFIMLADNKDFMQNPQGRKEGLEHDTYNSGDCAVREVFEELMIHIDKTRFTNLGYCGFTLRNILLGDGYCEHGTMTVFHINVSVDEVRHLLPASGEVHLDTITHVDTRSYPFKLDETTSVYFVPKKLVENDCLDLVGPNGKTLDCHQRELLYRCCRLIRKGVEAFPYLTEFDIRLLV